MRARLAVAALVAVLAAACGRDPPRHVVLVTIDTLRADHLGTYGYAPPTSPFVDALAAESTVFEHAFATAPSTAPSVASLMTGFHRASHGVRSNGATLPERVTTLAEALRANGFRTVARIANPLLDARVGFAQGFDDFAMPAGLNQKPPSIFDGAPLVAETRRLLRESGDARLFLWLHFYDPHGPYYPPEPYRARFDPAHYRWPDDRDLAISNGQLGLFLVPAYQSVDGGATPAAYRARYDAEIRYADDHVRAVVDALRESRLWDDTLFVLTADHGEALGEHGLYFQHGWFAYADCLHVPLLVRAPGLASSGLRVPYTVSLLDVTPTILDVVGIPPSTDTEGRSLRPLLDGSERGDRPAFAQSYHGTGSVTLRLGTTEYVFRPARAPGSPQPPAIDEPILPATAAHELYDLAADPRETQNLAGTRPELLAATQQRLRAWLAEQHRHGERYARGEGAAPAAPAGLDPVVESQLRALGYVD